MRILGDSDTTRSRSFFKINEKDKKEFGQGGWHKVDSNTEGAAENFKIEKHPGLAGFFKHLTREWMVWLKPKNRTIS